MENPLGEIVFKQWYCVDPVADSWQSRTHDVIHGMRLIQEEHAKQHDLFPPFDRMLEFLRDHKWSCPGRGFWAMGRPLIHEKKRHAALFNCGFVSTQSLETMEDKTTPFTMVMDGSMLGVGFGFDVLGAGTSVHRPGKDTVVHEVLDSREGWVSSVQQLLTSYFEPDRPIVQFDYTKIRPAGMPLQTFGGISCGPRPLQRTHLQLVDIMEYAIDSNDFKLSELAIIDLFNIIGCCVAAGNIRRSALLSLGAADCDKFLNSKNYERFAYREAWGYMSNNSVVVEEDTDFRPIVARAAIMGDPGCVNLNLSRKYGRMKDPPTNADYRVMGYNPCGEQNLEDGELCCLSSVCLPKLGSKEEFLEALQMAYCYCKTVNLLEMPWAKTNEVMHRNSRMGISADGIAMFLHRHSRDVLQDWLDTGYTYLRKLDQTVSRKWGVAESIKLTSVKPSGTMSLLSKTTPGIHFPESQAYIRRLRIAKSSLLLPCLQDAGYFMEPSVTEDGQMVVEVPVLLEEGIKTVNDITVEEQFDLLAFIQTYWADNSVSCTITFDPETDCDRVIRCLEQYRNILKGVSLMPRPKDGFSTAYRQLPFEPRSIEEIKARVAILKPIVWPELPEPRKLTPDPTLLPEVENGCTGDYCLRKMT